MKQAWETMVAFKLVWFRVLCYFFIPSVTTFLAQTETWSGETWDNTHGFLKIRLLLISCVSGIAVLVAFIDQSLARAREAVETKRVQAEFLNKNTGP